MAEPQAQQPPKRYHLPPVRLLRHRARRGGGGVVGSPVVPQLEKALGRVEECRGRCREKLPHRAGPLALFPEPQHLQPRAPQLLGALLEEDLGGRCREGAAIDDDAALGLQSPCEAPVLVLLRALQLTKEPGVFVREVEEGLIGEQELHVPFESQRILGDVAVDRLVELRNRRRVFDHLAHALLGFATIALEKLPEVRQLRRAELDIVGLEHGDDAGTLPAEVRVQQRRPPLLVAGIDARPLIDQFRNTLRVALAGGHVQRRRPLNESCPDRKGRIDVGAEFDQCGDARYVPIHRRVMQRGHPLVVSGVGVRAQLHDQRFDHLHLSRHGGDEEGRDAVVVRAVDRCLVVLHQRPHHLEVAFSGGVMQRPLAPLVLHVRAHPRPALLHGRVDLLEDCRLARRCRHVKRERAVAVVVRYRGAVVEQPECRVHVLVLEGQQEGRHARGLLSVVHVRAAPHQLLDTCQRPVLGGLVEHGTSPLDQTRLRGYRANARFHRL
mmetsp:Transcript_32190/g.76453  ORF Transcript_32190/g.76453 Transcript_32190/m.76453 type:complete len:496 (+) Transcript_32190:701-2188(+)